MITESESLFDGLEKMNTFSLLKGINSEDQKIGTAVESAIPKIELLIEAIFERMLKGGRLFYIGAGTSGRLGILDASECPPTFGVDHGLVNGIIAGGDVAIRRAVEFAEDDQDQAWKDLKLHDVNNLDSIIGITASGRTPYVEGGLKSARLNGCITAAIVCNLNSVVANAVSFPIEVIVGPEFITGSTRMKSGTAQKLILNMISTALMIKLGHVKGNLMIDMQLSNDKLMDRGSEMVNNITGLNSKESLELLKKYGSVRKAMEAWKKIKK